jgi:hypothetical protein
MVFHFIKPVVVWQGPALRDVINPDYWTPQGGTGGGVKEIRGNAAGIAGDVSNFRDLDQLFVGLRRVELPD